MEGDTDMSQASRAFPNVSTCTMIPLFSGGIGRTALALRVHLYVDDGAP